MIHILHPQTDEILGYLDNRGENVFWDDEHEQSTNGINIFKFKTPSHIDDARYLEGRARLLIPSERGGWQEFVAYEIFTLAHYKEVYALGAEVELNKIKNIAPGTHDGFALKQYINLATVGTEYQTGDVEYEGIKTLTFDQNLGAYDFLMKIATEFDVEIVIRVEVKNNQITGRFIDIIERVGTYEGKEIEYGKDLLGIERKNYSDRIITALLCIGPEREDGTRLSLTVTDVDAYQRWNRNGQHLLERYEPQTDNKDMTAERLEQLGKMELKKRIDSVDEYAVTGAVIEQVYPNEKVRLGDDIRIKNTEYQPTLYADARVLNVKRSLTDTSQKTYVIGNVITYSEDDIHKTFRDLQSQYGLRVIKSHEAPPGSINIIWIKTDPASEFEIAHTWNGTEWIATTPTTAEHIGAEPKIPSQSSSPNNPTIGDKWVDTSVSPMELKMWDGSTWNAVQGPKGENGYTPVKGTDYFDGVDGADGTDGTSSFMWIRYSNFADGSGMVTSPVNAKYIGISTTQVDSAPTSAASYKWSLIKGTDGVPGETGPDGKTSYLHIKYSNDGGATLTANSGETVGDWIGTYVDFTQADSASVSAYVWNKVKGEKGDNGYTPIKGTDYFDGVDGDAGAPGSPGTSSYLWVRYSQNANGSGMVTDPANAKYIGIATTTISTAPTAYTSYLWALIKGTDGIPGEPGENGLTSYLHIKYSDNGTTFTANNGETVGMYIGTYVDFVQADSLTFSSYTWNKVKGDKGDTGDTGLRGLQGDKGDTGLPGDPGENGISSYTHIAYSTSATGSTGFSVSDPVGKTYIGMYVDSIETDSTTPSKYAWSLIKGADGSQGIPGNPGENGLTPYLHIAYATNATGTLDFSTTVSTNKTYIGQYTDFIAADSTDASKYAWSLIKGDKGDTGPTGPQGVPGPEGPNGATLYTWVKYADNVSGAGMSDSPAGKAYIGFAYNKAFATESSVAADYKWALILGPQGNTGPTGATLFTWLKYADSPRSGMSDSPTGKAYMGLAYNKSTSSESLVYADYSWSLIEGEKGDTGPTGPTGSQGIPGAPGSSLFTWLKYADTPTTGMNDSPTGKTYIGLAYNKASATESSTYADYTWSLIKGDKGATGPDGATLYTWIKYADNAAGSGLVDSPAGKTYIGIAYNKSTPTKSTLASDYVWSLILGPKGDTGPTGPQGPQGVPGAVGSDGATLYTWIKYADTPTSGMADSPTGKVYIGLAHNKTASSESAVYADYSWSLIKGDKGVPGEPGSDGVTTYTWIKYADTITGTNLSDSPAGKRYLGIAVNKTTASESAVASDYVWSPLFEAIVPISGGKIFNNPASFYQGAPSVAGALVITTPILNPFMTTIKISGYNYVSNKSTIDLTVSFYAYSSSIISHSFVSRGDFPIERVRIGRDASNRAVIIIGDTNTAWSYPAISVDSAQITFSTPPDSYQNGWIMSISSTIPTLTSLAEIGGTDLKKDVETSQLTADGKNTVLYSPSIPSTVGRKLGDVWFDTDDGHKMYRFNNSWVAAQFGENAIVANSITANHIKSLLGLNVNDQFMVDNLGNVSFAGALSGATGTFSGVLSGATGTFDGNVVAEQVVGSVIRSGDPLWGYVQLSDKEEGTAISGTIEVIEKDGGGTIRRVYVDGSGVSLDDPNQSSTPVKLSAQAGVLNVTSASGSLSAGAQNASYAHFSTDRPQFHFSKPVTVAGDVDVAGLKTTASATIGDRLRMLSSGAYSYIQAGTSSSDTLAQLRIARSATVATPINLFEVYANKVSIRGESATEIFSMYENVSDYGHAKLKSKNGLLNFMNGATAAIAARNAADTAYIPLWASAFTVNSCREVKKNIEEYNDDALHEVMTTPVHRYHMIEDSDAELKRVGLIYDEIPADMADISGTGVELYPMVSILWRAVQQLSEKLEAKEKVIAEQQRKIDVILAHLNLENI
jgi:phage minor structural protein